MADEKIKIPQVTHPSYDETTWTKYRNTFEGGDAFVESYVEKYSVRETDTDFTARKAISYCAAHAKSTVIEIRDAIFQRMPEVQRNLEEVTYKEAITGSTGGVDFEGNTMMGFIGRKVLPDLLSIGKVGVFVDKAVKSEQTLLNETEGVRPYLYAYPAEDIRSWSHDSNGILRSILLRDYVDIVDEETLLVTGQSTEFRLLKMETEGKVDVIFYNEDGIPQNSMALHLSQIPFVIFEISHSLLKDTASYQVALTNLASSDMNYAVKSNFPFYVEQYDMMGELTTNLTRHAATDTYNAGTAAEAKLAKQQEIEVGPSSGRRYPKDLNQPAFIHPSAEPFMASMQKQKDLQQEIRKLTRIAVQNIEPRQASADSKAMDQRSLEAGLSYIGLELEYGERQIARIWAEYQGKKDTEIVVKYPKKYNLKTDADIRIESKEDREIMATVPSLTFQKHLARKIADNMLGTRIPESELDAINAEIDAAEILIVDPERLLEDVKAGILSEITACKLRGYKNPEQEVKMARKEHAERAARIVTAQTSAKEAARGAPDVSTDTSGDAEKDVAKQEKEIKE